VSIRTRLNLNAVVLLILAVLLGGGGVIGGAPITDPGFRVLVVEETDDRSKLTRGQMEAMFSTDAESVKKYIESKGGTLRVLDKDDDTTMLDKPWAALMARPRKSLPWLEVANPPSGHEGALPAEESETLAIVKKAGG
jgi:hypothetical protein